MKRTAPAPRLTVVPQCRSASWVAQRLGGVSVQWVHQLHKAGRLRGILLRGVKDGPGTGRLVFREQDVVAYMVACGMPVDPATGSSARTSAS